MEHKHNVYSNKRTDNKLKDRGDNQQKNNRTKHAAPKTVFLPDRGDTGVKSNKTEKLMGGSKTINEFKNKIANNSESTAVSKKNIVESERHLNRLIDIDEKKRIRDKYTVRLKAKVPNNKCALKCNVKDSLLEMNNDSSKKRKNDSEEKDESDECTISTSTKIYKLPDYNEKFGKRPVIRTITAKNDATKVFKAVTFTEPKQKSTQIKIKIPNDVLTKTTKIPKLIQNYERVSRTSVKEKPKKNRVEKRKYKAMSPELKLKNGSPPTEVAKWAPNCINRHTKPYYEAWVNTKLTAFSKMSKEDKLLFETQHLNHLRKMYQRQESPELVYENFLDERYTGKIKINHR